MMKLLMATENGAQELRVKVAPSISPKNFLIGLSSFNFQGGTQQISELLCDKIGRDRIHLKEALESVDQFEDYALMKTSTGNTY